MNAKGRHAAKQFTTALKHLQRGRLIEAERLCREACTSDPQQGRYFHMLGVVAHRLGRPNAAELIARAIALQPHGAGAHNDLGVVLASQGRLAEAALHFERALRLNPNYAEAHANLGIAWQGQGKLEKARAHLERAVELEPSARAHIRLGTLSSLEGRREEAESHYLRAIEIDATDGVAHYHLANTLKEAGRAQAALAHYRRAIALKPDFAEAHNNLGTLLHELGALQEAAQCCQRAVALRPNFGGAHNNLGNALRELGRLEDAIAQYRQAVTLDPAFSMAHYNLGVSLRRQGKLPEARACFAQALAIKPDYLEAKLALCIAQLPILYAQEAEIAGQRAAYHKHLTELQADIERRETFANLAEAVGSHQPFYLAYQGCNDRDLQALYGKLVSRIVAERYPIAPIARTHGPDEPVKVGIVSGFFRQHSNWKIPIKGWLTQLDRQRFRVFGYYTGIEEDQVTRTAADLCERFIQGPLSPERWRQTILGDALHVLIYPEVGMDPIAAQLAAQRLAPIQCNSWGHPTTGGFPTLDYFLSSDLMEPPQGQDHYTEQLIRLPNLSIYYEPPEFEAILLDRAVLGLRPAATAFWCSQAVSKYLPQFDQVFPRIARAGGDCQFVFIQFPGAQHVTELFNMRLERAFAALGMKAANHCVFLPRLDPHRFHAAMGQCDIFLDGIGWSGCNSTLESLAHNLPIVTMTGALMRGRHTAAILRMMGVAELIAESVDEYVATAVRLACDRRLRSAFSNRIAESKQRVLRDRNCIAALEKFLVGVTQ